MPQADLPWGMDVGYLASLTFVGSYLCGVESFPLAPRDGLP